MPIRFFSEGIEFKIRHPRKVKSWISSVAKKEGKLLGEINYIFCSDKYLLGLNQEFLSHNTLTDIITFDNSEKDKVLNAEIYISIERVAENASKFKVDFYDELLRVIIHGVMHLCGYGDKKNQEKVLMRKKESASLSLWRKSFT